MIQVKFKNLEKSPILEKNVKERLQSAIDKFPKIKLRKLDVTVSMENSPSQAGEDVFQVKLYSYQGKRQDLLLQKAANNPYLALASVCDHLLERLSRLMKKSKSTKVKQARRQWQYIAG